MNNDNVVVNPLITNQPIPPSDLLRVTLYKSYKDINFDRLFINAYSNDTDYFIHRKGITFRDHVGRQLMTGNELLYYPELAKKIREMDDYPILKRCHEIDQDIEGMEFLDYFCGRARTCYNHFEAELDNASLQVNQFIDSYGQERFMPILNNQAYVKGDTLIIHDVEWPLQDCYKPLNAAHCIDLYRLFNIPYQVMNTPYQRDCFCIEDIIPDTPFIAIRIRKTYQHKGHVKWYSLDTRQVVSKNDRDCWKKPL